MQSVNTSFCQHFVIYLKFSLNFSIETLTPHKNEGSLLIVPIANLYACPVAEGN